MLTAVSNAIGTVIEWVGTFITALTDTTSATPGALTPLLPLFAVGIAISAILLGRLSFAEFKSLKKSGSLSQFDMVIRPEGIFSRGNA